MEILATLNSFRLREQAELRRRGADHIVHNLNLFGSRRSSEEQSVDLVLLGPDDLPVPGPTEGEVESEQRAYREGEPPTLPIERKGDTIYAAGCVLAGTTPDVYWQVRRRMCTGRYDAGCVLAGTTPDVYWQVRRRMCTGRYDAGCVLAGTTPDVYWQVRRRMCTGRYDAGCVLATT